MKRRTFLKGIAAFLAAPLAFVGAKQVKAVTFPTETVSAYYDPAHGEYGFVNWKTYYTSVTLNESWMKSFERVA